MMDRAEQAFSTSRNFRAGRRAARTINRSLCAAAVQLALSTVLGCSDNTTTSMRATAGASGAAAGTDTSSGAGTANGGVAGQVLTGGGGGGGAAGSGGVNGGAGHAGAAGSGGGGAGGAGSSIPSPARLLCIGDSITEAESSWIFPLQDALREAGCEVTLIGYEEGPYNGPYAPKAGYEHRRIAAGGFSTTGILNLIKERGLGGTPDLVIEYLGANNAYGGFIDGKYNPDNRDDPDGSYARDNAELMNIVRAANPRTKFLLMKLQDNILPVIDDAIDDVVQAQHQPDSEVMAVAPALNVETSDGLHPTPAGSVTLAGPISIKLVEVLQAAGAC
jgi:hypothetical protein